MRNRCFSLAFAMCVTALSAHAQVIDQNAPTNNVRMAGFTQCCLAQSFQQSNSNISGAGIFLHSTGVSGTISISLWDALPNAWGAHQLAAGSVFAVQSSWADVFWSTISVTPNTTYYLMFGSNNQSMGITGDVTNGYSRGHVYASYAPFTSYDYTFRTYADLNATLTPEPASMALLATGLVAVFAVARRRRKAP